MAMLSMSVAAFQSANAGSAIATDGHGNTVYTFGHAKAVEIRRALEMARMHGLTDARIIGATDVTGYGAIAVARKGTGSILGTVLGCPSRAEAEHRAIEGCLRGGGTDPKVRVEWHG